MSRRVVSRFRAMSVAVALVLVGWPAAGNPLSDLRQVLNRYPAQAPFAAVGTVQVHGGAEGSARGGASTFEVESGLAGFAIRLLPDVLEAAEAEATAKKRDPNSPTPTRTAMVALTIFDVMDAVDGAAMLLNDLSGATLIRQSAAARSGKGATLLRIKVKPTLATQSRFVNEPKIELRIWIGADGVPIAAERDSDYSGSFLFLKAGNVRKESWEFSVRGDRLYTSRNDANDRASVAGKSMVTSRSVSYSPK
jgi:hypothetical protein